MRFKTSYIFIPLLAIALSFTMSCRKQKTLSVGGVVLFSVDTLGFDTVFTQAGSFTSGLLIYNPQNEAIELSSVHLLHGNSSYFHLNVDGFSGNAATNLKIAAHDSLYVFATVNINPNDSTNPFIITDSLVTALNGKNFYVPFTAYGQNAHYIVSDSISTAVNWIPDLPYVVIHSCVVGSGGSLNIQKGCRIYMHQDARFFVFGKMTVDTAGTPGMDSVVFQGDRLDRAYFGYIGYPGEWGGFYFVGGAPGSEGVMKNVVIKNCGGPTVYNGFQAPGAAIEVDSDAELTITHSIIENSFGYGIFSNQGNVTATSCRINTTGQEALAVVNGGYDSITNCTFANYGTAALTHANYGTVTILNYLSNGTGGWSSGNLNAVLRNCIVYGSLDSEIICDSLSGATASLRMDHCLLKMGTVRESFITFSNCLFNQDPLFKDPYNGNFNLGAGSPAIGAGIVFPGVQSLYDSTWLAPAGQVDIGCY
jgi:hypothetical protein